MKKVKNPFILPALGMMAVLLIAVSVFYHFSRADDKTPGLSTEEAKYIALNDAGEQAKQVTYTKASLEQDSGILVYKIDFYTDNKNYEYEISAQTGSIRDKEITIFQKESSSTAIKENTVEASSQNQNDTGSVIGVKKAQAIALAAADLKDNQVSFAKTNLETEDGNLVYEIEFTRDAQKYEYDIDAYTGTILSYDIDRKEKFSVTDNDDGDDLDEEDRDDDDNDDDRDDDDDDDQDHDDDD